jgi:hypothetical protein
MTTDCRSTVCKLNPRSRDIKRHAGDGAHHPRRHKCRAPSGPTDITYRYNARLQRHPQRRTSSATAHVARVAHPQHTRTCVDLLCTWTAYIGKTSRPYVCLCSTHVTNLPIGIPSQFVISYCTTRSQEAPQVNSPFAVDR